MVDSVIDPIRVPTIELSQSEIDDIKALMESGQLPPDFLDRHYAAKENNVFGHDHKKDADGKPIEQGIGSAANQTRNQINAYKKYAKCEDDYSKEKYDATVQRMERELAECNARRKAKK
jgi:hypothetical protein